MPGRLPVTVVAFLVSLCPAQTFNKTLFEAFRLKDAGQTAEAKQLLEGVIAEAHQSQDKWAEAEARRGLGQILSRQTRFADAREQFDTALPLFLSIQDRLGAGRTYSDIAYIEWTAGDRNKQRALYLKSLAEFEAIKSLPEKAGLLYNLTFTSDDMEEVQRWVEEALTLARRLENRILEGQLHHTWGDRLFNHGDFSGAVRNLEQAISLLEEDTSRLRYARALISLGRVYRVHGFHEKSLEIYRRVLVLQERVRDRLGIVQTVNAIGIANRYLGRLQQHLEYAEMALKLANETGSNRVILTQQVHVANAHNALGNYPRAVEILRELLTGGEEPDDEVWQNLAYAYRGLKQFGPALEAADRAIRLSAPEKLPGNLLARAMIKRDTSDADGAIADIEQGIRSIEQQRLHAVPTDEMKRGFADQNQRLFAAAVETLSQFGRHGEAMEVAEQGRGRAFLDLLASREPMLKPSDQTQLAALRDLDHQLQPAGASERGTRLPVLMREGPSQTGELWNRWRGASPELRSFVTAEPHTVAQLAATSARLQSTMLAYWVNETSTHIWVVKPDGSVHGVKVAVSREQLANGVGETWAAPKSAASRGATERMAVLRGGEPVELSHTPKDAWMQLYRWLILPVRSHLPKEKGSLLTIVPHGPLFRLSFAALMDQNGRYLVERYRLHYTPAGAVLDFTGKKRSVAGEAAALLIADPVGMTTPDGTALPALPGARREIQAIAGSLLGSRVTTLAGKEAGERAVRAAVAGKSIVHFATHGILRNDEPSESFLALAARDEGATFDGRLTAREIYELDMNADLVVLSACRSGLGKVSSDGMIGLTRAFFYAGARSVMATLWDVADEPTSRLISDFYRQYYRDRDKSGALRLAQLRLIASLRNRQVTVPTAVGPVVLPEAPMFWAGFVLAGEP